MRTYQVIEELEKRRKEYSFYDKFKYIGMAMFLIPFFGSFLAAQYMSGLMFFPFAGVVLTLVVSFKQSGIKREFDNIYKEVFAKAALEEILGNVDYRWQHGFTEQQVATFGLVKMGNRFASEDYLKSQYKGVEFEQSDVTVKRVVKTKNGSSTTIYFRGRMFKFRAAMKKVMALQIFSDNFHYRASVGVPMKKIEMEDVDFNKRFDVLSAREHDAFYRLTPPFMEKLKELSNKYENVAIYMREEDLYIGLGGSRDSFNADMRKEINFPAEMARMREDIQDILDIIDILELGNE